MKYLALTALLVLPGCRGVLCLVCMEPLYPKVEPDAGQPPAVTYAQPNVTFAPVYIWSDSMPDAGSPTFPYIWDDAIIPTETAP